MSALDHLAGEIRKSGGLTVLWWELKNVHFRGDNALGDTKEWARKENFNASFDYLEKSLTHCVVESVFFRPMNPSK